jgi:hypothetical protein
MEMKRPLPWHSGATLLLASSLASAQDLGGGYAHLLAIVAQPEIAATSVDIGDDATLDSIHLPYYTEFGEGWYAQGSLGYSVLEQEFDLLDGRAEYESEWTVINGVIEAGRIFPVTDSLSLIAGVSAGVARLENDASLKGGFFPPELEGSVFNWDTNAGIYRAHGSLRYDQEHGDYRVKAVGHLTYSYVDSYSESRRFAGFSDDSGAAIALVDVSRRISDERPLFIIGHLGATAFIGDNRDELGFTEYFEAGASLGYDRYAAGVLFIFGDDVDGLSLTFIYDF